MSDFIGIILFLLEAVDNSGQKLAIFVFPGSDYVLAADSLLLVIYYTESPSVLNHNKVKII